MNDILKALDRRHGVILILLDMSAAFNTVDHDVLVTRLEQRFGLTGCAIAWIKSYLSDRSQSVKIHGVFGVPQGSALGPLLFTIYTTPIGDIIRRHQLNFHLYAEDTQLYVNFELSDDDNKLSSLNKIENCVSEVRMWMNANFLKVNEEKTVALYMRQEIIRRNITLLQSRLAIATSPPVPVLKISELYSMLKCLWLDGCSHPPDMLFVLLPSQEYHFYPGMPDRASRDSTRAFSGGFEVGLRKRSSVRYSRRSHQQITESAELCSPIGSSLRQTRPHHSSIREASLAYGEAASDV